jgi:hypothetical protein
MTAEHNSLREDVETELESVRRNNAARNNVYLIHFATGKRWRAKFCGYWKTKYEIQNTVPSLIVICRELIHGPKVDS